MFRANFPPVVSHLVLDKCSIYLSILPIYCVLIYFVGQDICVPFGARIPDILRMASV